MPKANILIWPITSQLLFDFLLTAKLRRMDKTNKILLKEIKHLQMQQLHVCIFLICWRLLFPEDVPMAKRGYLTPSLAREHVIKLWEKEGE